MQVLSINSINHCWKLTPPKASCKIDICNGFCLFQVWWCSECWSNWVPDQFGALPKDSFPPSNLCSHYQCREGVSWTGKLSLNIISVVFMYILIFLVFKSLNVITILEYIYLVSFKVYLFCINMSSRSILGGSVHDACICDVLIVVFVLIVGCLTIFMLTIYRFL